MAADRRALFMLSLLLACHSTPKPVHPGQLSGVVMAHGAPAAGAQVQLVNSAVTVTADATGAFVIDPLPSATYALWVTFNSNAYAAAVEGISFDAGTGEDIGSVSLQQTGGLTGHVMMSANPVAQAALAFIDANGVRVPGAVVLSDASGAYSITGVPAAQFTVKALYSVDAQVFSAVSQPVTIVAGVQTSADIDLQSPTPASPGTVSGVAVYSGGALPDIAVLLSRSGRADITVASSPPQFTMTSVPAGVYALGVAETGLDPLRVPYVLVDSNVDVGTIVFSKANPTATATCASLTPPPCTAGQPGCDPDNTAPTPNGEEVNAACLCQPGVFLAADGTCIDECASGAATCDVNATCLGGAGTFYCTCDSGYVGDGTSCEEILPEINELEVYPQSIGSKPGGVISATFQTNELIPLARVSVTVGSWPFSCTEMGSQPWIYVCTYAITGMEIPAGTETSETITATISDSRGNSNTATGFVYFDFKQPGIASLTVSYAQGATSAAPGSPVVVSLTADEPLSSSAPPSVSAALTNGTMQFSIEQSTQMSESASLTATVPAGTPAGQYQLTVVLTDFVGNVSTLLPATGLIVVTD